MILENGLMDNSVGAICDEERLGREIFTRNHFNPTTGTVRPRAFYPPSNEDAISVNRLDAAPPGFLSALGYANGKGRKQTFYGWAKMLVRDVNNVGQEVVAKPIPDDNPYHAEIIFSKETTDDASKREIALGLANAARFGPPESES